MQSPFTAACLSIFAGALLSCQPALAQAPWKPERPVEIIVMCQPGCGPDIAARNMSIAVGAELNQTVDALYAQLKVLLADLDLVKPTK